MSAEFIGILKKEVDKRLRTDYRHIDKQEILRSAIVADVKKLLEAHGNNPSDPVVRIFQKANKQVKEIINDLNKD